MMSSGPDPTRTTTPSPAWSTNDIMSSTNPHRTLRGPIRTPSAPNSEASIPIEPKSDYLRHMLESKRAQQAAPVASTPAPKSDTKPSASTPLRNSSSDPWLDQARSEDETAKSTRVRHARRPSDGGIRRMPTQGEHMEIEKLKQAQLDLKIDMNTVKDRNKSLEAENKELKARNEELEPLLDRNFELEEENNHLTMNLQNMKDEFAKMQEDNKAILKFQREFVTNMDKQDAALEEAAGIIVRLEKEKAALTQENVQLSEQLAEAQNLRTASSATYHGDMDGAAAKYPMRVHSIDESRPSTSHFDSDYYSQPASPQVRVSKDSLDDVPLSERTKNFLSMKKDNHRSTLELKKSARDLKNRMSDASTKAEELISAVPDVPQVPAQYQEQFQEPPQQSTLDPQIIATRTPRRIKPRQHLSPSVMAQPQAQPIRPATSGPRTPTAESKAGLRAMYRGNLTVDTSTRGAQHSPGYNSSPLATRPSKPLRQLTPTALPDRYSTRQAATKPSREQLHDLAKETLGPESPEDQRSEWTSSSFPSAPSVLSDLTTEPDAREEWWCGMDRHLQQPLLLSTARAPPPQRDFALSMALAGAQPTRWPSGQAAHARGASLSQGPPSYMGMQDSLFNPSESEEDFLRRTTSFRSRR